MSDKHILLSGNIKLFLKKLVSKDNMVVKACLWE